MIARFSQRVARVGAALVLLGCSKSDIELRADDKTQLVQILAEDTRASAAMSEADVASRQGHTERAIEALATRARPAVDGGLRLASSSTPKTEWGRTQKATLTKLLEDRGEMIGRYSEALASHEESKLLSSLEAQAELERRAVAVAAEVNGPR